MSSDLEGVRVTQGVIDSTLGALFIGFAVSCGIYGILVSQIFSYFRNYPGDRPLFKYLVSTNYLICFELRSYSLGLV